MAERYTRSEVTRIVGVGERQLHYWEKLRLVRPRARWGERFYSFADLVALKAIKHLTEKRIPARRLRRAIGALQYQLGATRAPLTELRILSNGGRVVVIPPAPHSQPIEPLTGQFVLNFETRELANNVHSMASPTAEKWFEIGLACDSAPETFSQAVEAYRRALELAPDWVEAQINLGTTLYQLHRLEESEQAFQAALALEPQNPIAHFNLGCVLDELGKLDAAIEHLRRAVQLAPRYPDAHFTLALAYEKRGQKRQAREHWALYLRDEPQGPWADYARSCLVRSRAPRRSRAPIPFGTNG